MASLSSSSALIGGAGDDALAPAPAAPPALLEPTLVGDAGEQQHEQQALPQAPAPPAGVGVGVAGPVPGGGAARKASAASRNSRTDAPDEAGAAAAAAACPGGDAGGAGAPEEEGAPPPPPPGVGWIAFRVLWSHSI